MTKEIEFLEKQGYIFDKDKYLLFMEEFFSSEHKIKDICDLLRKYADQETEKLRAELSEKDAEIERLEQEKIMLERYCSKYESELSELKESKKELLEMLVTAKEYIEHLVFMFHHRKHESIDSSEFALEIINKVINKQKYETNK